MKTDIRFEKRDLRFKIVLLFFLPFLTFAQKDTVKVSFSEETVDKFEKTNLLDEYDKAFGGNRVVKSGLRLALIQPTLPSSSRGAWVLQYERKISKSHSIVGSIGNGSEYNSQFRIGIEGRWYYQMKNKIENDGKKSNITGNYLSLRYQHEPFWVSEFYNAYTVSYMPTITKFMYREINNLSLTWGKQFGNNVDFGVSIGIKRGRQSYIDQRQYWINDLKSPFGFTPYISTHSQIGVGLMFPRKQKQSNNSCEFLGCNYEVKQMFKLSLNNAFYADKFKQNIRFDASYERKLGSSPFSLNTNVSVGFANEFRFRQVSTKDSVIKNAFNRELIYKIPLFGDTKDPFQSINFQISEQLRYYVGMKNKILKGQSASNLNGFYIGAFIKYQRLSQEQPNWSNINLANKYVVTRNTLIYGVGLGYQMKTNKTSFIDAGIDFGIEQNLSISTPYLISKTNQRMFYAQPYLKLGFAK